MRFIILFLLLIESARTANINPKVQQRLLLVSLDGFRHDYIDRYDLENFKSFLIKDQASKAPYMNPQFTTQTFPNHWSIVTGSYVETHGIVANSFFDPQLNESFSRDNENYSDLKWWNSSKPIWFSAVEKGLKTGSYFWPGSDTLFHKSSLYKRLDFNKSVTFENKIDQIIDWFKFENYTFVSLYHHQPDAAAHRYGIDSIEFNQTIKEIDKSFGYLISKLKENDLFDSYNFNLIIVSDHGMVNIDKHVILDDYINGTDAHIWSENGNLMHFKPLIDPKTFFSKINSIPFTKAYYKKDLPEKFFYKNNHRISDIVLVADEGVGMILMHNKKLRNGQEPPVNYEDKKKSFIKDSEKASHGFDQFYESMRGIFLVYGNQFKKNFTSENHIENIDVYPLVCNLLELNCEIRNGSFNRIASFIKYNSSNSLSLNFLAALIGLKAYLISYLV